MITLKGSFSITFPPHVLNIASLNHDDSIAVATWLTLHLCTLFAEPGSRIYPSCSRSLTSARAGRRALMKPNRSSVSSRYFFTSSIPRLQSHWKSLLIKWFFSTNICFKNNLIYNVSISFDRIILNNNWIFYKQINNSVNHNYLFWDSWTFIPKQYFLNKILNEKKCVYKNKIVIQK